METLWIIALALCLLSDLSNGLQCRDDDNNPVDWFVIYKVPKRVSTIPEVREGTAYVHRTSRAEGMSWTLSNKNVTMQDSALGNTLFPLYNEIVARKSIGIIYNNADPTKGRTRGPNNLGKGVLMVDERQGFWMVHSVATFPALPSSGVSKQDVHKLGSTYDFTDSGKKKDLWDDFVGPSLKTDLWVMTSGTDTTKLPPKCNGHFTVEGIEKIQLKEVNLTITCASDASKWAISPDGSWFCIGDLNRVSTKSKTCGGAVCLQARDLSVIFRRMILDVDKCPPRVAQAPMRNSVDQSGAKRMRPSTVRQPHN